MKTGKLVILIVALLTGFIACQKELHFDGSGISSGTLKKDGTGNCMPSAVTGIYKRDTTLTANNFIDVNVDVTATGTYSIATDTVNGFSFKGTGSFSVTGNNIVRLYGTGKPLAQGTSSFTVKYGTSTCVIDILVAGPATPAAVYTLEGAPGSCAGFTLGAGTYTAGQATTASNTVATNVTVTSPGTYDLGTDTINGVYFRVAGTFAANGLQSITLAAHGTPTIAGSFNYTLKHGAESCIFSITVAPAGGGGAVFTMGNSPNSCTGVILAGTYMQGIAMNAANTIQVDVNVTTPGTYNVVVLAVNNVSFSGAGSFTVTGAQKLTLNASGTPAGAGNFEYIVSAPGGSSCKFTITYSSPAPPANIDYIPQTAMSNWSTKLVGGGPGDTTYMEVSPNTIVKGGQTFRIFEIKDNGTPTDSLFFRRNSSIYYQYIDNDFGLLDAPYKTEVKILDSSLNAGATWVVNLGPNTAGGGTIVITSAKIDAAILEKGSSETVAGNTYGRVIKVKYTYSANVQFLGNTVVAEEERWYAKGYGIIKTSITALFPAPSPAEVVETTRTQIY